MMSFLQNFLIFLIIYFVLLTLIAVPFGFDIDFWKLSHVVSVIWAMFEKTYHVIWR